MHQVPGETVFYWRISPKSEIIMSYALAGLLLCTCIFFSLPHGIIVSLWLPPLSEKLQPFQWPPPQTESAFYKFTPSSSFQSRQNFCLSREDGTSHVRFLRNEEPYLHGKGGMTNLTHKVPALLWNRVQLCRILLSSGMMDSYAEFQQTSKQGCLFVFVFSIL